MPEFAGHVAVGLLLLLAFGFARLGVKTGWWGNVFLTVALYCFCLMWMFDGRLDGELTATLSMLGGTVGAVAISILGTVQQGFSGLIRHLSPVQVLTGNVPIHNTLPSPPGRAYSKSEATVDALVFGFIGLFFMVMRGGWPVGVTFGGGGVLIGIILCVYPPKPKTQTGQDREQS